jgi:transposase
MIQLTPQHKIFICLEPIDFRKGIDGIASICKNQMDIDPFSGIVCAFTNKRRIMVRLLIYDGTGFWLCSKRFSEGKLKWWPATSEQAELVTPIQLQIILQQSDPRLVKLKSNWRKLE